MKQPSKQSGQVGDNSKGTTATFSSPSQVKTADLTEIYEVPSASFATINDVIAANGFELGDELGKGSYAIVYRARRKSDNLPLACKVVEASSKVVKNELFIMERINHPHIIKLYKHFMIDLKEPKKGMFYIFMQMAEGDNLSTQMRHRKTGLPEELCKRMFAQMVSAVSHMHQKGIAHRDLKMGNVLLDKKSNCLVTDFGLSRVNFRESKGGTIYSSKYCGTLPYMAPEILLARDHQVEYSPFVADVWALGVLLYCIINRGYPFPEKENMLVEQMKHKVKFIQGNVIFEPNAELIKLMYALLDPNVDRRITMDQLMHHPWIAEEVSKIENARKEGEQASPSE